MNPPAKSNFANALRAVRLERALSQEDFVEVSGRTYVSRLENGGADPTLVKIDELSSVLNVHPLTLLTLCYCTKGTPAEVERLLNNVRTELDSLEGLSLVR